MRHRRHMQRILLCGLARVVMSVVMTVVMSVAMAGAHAGKPAAHYRVLDINLQTMDVEAGTRAESLRGRQHAQRMKVRRYQRRAGAMARQRSPEMSRHHLVIIARDRRGREVARQLVQDPRYVRMETADESGKLSGDTYFNSDADLRVVLPDRKNIVAVGVYKPRWNGEQFELEALGDLELPTVSSGRRP